MTSEGKAGGKRGWRSLAILAAIAVTVAVLVPVALRVAAHSALSSLGFPAAQGGSVSLGLHRARIAGIRIGRDGMTTVAVSYSPGGIARGRLDTIAVTDTVLHGVVALNGALTFDGYQSQSRPQAVASEPSPIGLPASAVTIDDLRLALETPVGAVDIRATGTLLPVDGGLHMTGLLSLARGTVTGAAPLDLTLAATGWMLSLTPIRLDMPDGKGQTSPISGHLTLARSSGGAVTGEARLDGENLTLQSMPVRKLGLGFVATAGGQSGTVALTPADGSAGIGGTLKNDKTGMSATLTASLADVAPIAALLGKQLTGPLRANLTASAGAAAGPRPVTLALAYDGSAPGGMVLRAAKLQAAGAFDPAANSLTLTSCGPFSADSLAIGGMTLTKLSGCLGPLAGHALFAQAPSGTIALAGVIANAQATIPVALAQIAIPSAQASAAIVNNRLDAFDARLSGGVTVAALGAGIRDLALTAHRESGALSGKITGTFGATAAKSPTLPIAGNLGDGSTLTLTAGPGITAKVTGQTARLDLALAEIGESGTDVLKLMPGLATTVSKLSGAVTVHAEADWSGKTMTSRGSVALKSVGATTPNFTVEDVNATVALTSLKPLTTADNQVLTTGRLVAGVPLTAGKVTFGLDRRNVLDIGAASWTVAGGTIGTYDQQLDLYGPDQHLGLVAKGVDLAQLLAVLDVKGLSAEGTVEGVIPLRHTKDTIFVEHGVLQTRAPGVIRYDPADTPSFLQGQPGEGTAILREALKDFHYRQLGVTIDGVLGGEEQIKMTLNGANPTLYGGLPVALNVNLTGALDSIARSSVQAYTRPAATVGKTLQKKTGEKK